MTDPEQKDMMPEYGDHMEGSKKPIAQIIELIVRGIDVFQKNRITVYSGYSTLFIATAMIPFLILIISVVNLMPRYSAEDAADMLLRFLPDLGSVRDLVVSLVEEFKDQSGGLLASIAAVTTLWSASKGVMAVQKGLNELDSREDGGETDGVGNGMIAEKGVAYVRRVLKRLTCTVTLIILIPAMMVLEVAGDSIAGVIGSLLVMLLAFLAVLQIFAKLPEIPRTFRSQLPGALLTVLCWYVFTELFSFFISRSYRYSNLYGSLAALFLLILWLRYMVMILFAGGVFNRVLESEDTDSAHAYLNGGGLTD